METKVPENRTHRQSYKTLTIRISRVSETSGITVKSARTVRDYFSDVADLAQEAFWTLTLNTRDVIIRRHLITLGVLDGTLIHPREIMRPALLDAASKIIVVHNHPGQTVEPSHHDRDLTHQLYYVCRVHAIDLVDHIIIARSGRNKRRLRHYSFNESGELHKLARKAFPKRLF